MCGSDDLRFTVHSDTPGKYPRSTPDSVADSLRRAHRCPGACPDDETDRGVGPSPRLVVGLDTSMMIGSTKLTFLFVSFLAACAQASRSLHCWMAAPE